MMRYALVGAKLFDGEAFHEGKAVIVSDRNIENVVLAANVPKGLDHRKLQGGLLVPGFIDVQVNGGGGVLLNESPTVAGLRAIAASHRRHGTTGMLPTVITDAAEVTQAAVAAVCEARRLGMASILGLHIEGPFLDPARKGAHDSRYIRTMTGNDVATLTGANCGSLMVTLAPNMVSGDYIAALDAAGVRVSLGHSDARFEQANAALRSGAKAFTHLFNAMSQMTGREPGMVGAALADKKSFIGIIADGFHVHDAMLKLAFASTRSDRFMLISDAMPPAAGGPDAFELQGRSAIRVSGRLQLPDGTLAGSNLTMDEALRYAVKQLGVELGTALQMSSRNPARFLGRGDLGHIRSGALASLVHLDEDLNVLDTWVEGA